MTTAFVRVNDPSAPAGPYPSVRGLRFDVGHAPASGFKRESGDTRTENGLVTVAREGHISVVESPAFAAPIFVTSVNSFYNPGA